MGSVLSDHDVISRPSEEPYTFCDLGDSYSVNPFWSNCTRRMACAACNFTADQRVIFEGNLEELNGLTGIWTTHRLQMAGRPMNVEALIYLAEAGRGIACVPDFAVKKSLEDGRLQKVLGSCLVGSSTFHVVWPSSRQMAPKVRVFVDYVVENFSKGLMALA